LSLCFNWAPRHEGVLGEWRYISTHSLTSVLDRGEWSASRTGRFTPRERAPGTHRIGGWVGPRDVLDAVVKRKILSPRRESNPRTMIVQPVAQRYTDWANAALTVILKHMKYNTHSNYLLPSFILRILFPFLVTRQSDKLNNYIQHCTPISIHRPSLCGTWAIHTMNKGFMILWVFSA
jgi:hypothetical protein